jgi:hypothetical protein
MNRSPATAFRAFLGRGLCLLLLLLVPLVAFAKKPTTEKPRPGMAVLNGQHNGVSGWGFKPFIGVRIGVLDGDSQRTGLYNLNLPTTVHVAPGRHTVRLEYYAGMQTSASGHFWFDAEADRSYTARYQGYGGMIEIWIEDDATRQRVGGVGDGKDEGVATPAKAVAPEDAAEAKAPPPAPDATTAVVVSDPGNGPTGAWGTWDGKTIDRQEVVAVDGVKHRARGKDYQSFRLAPGRHTLTVRYFKSTMEVSETLAFTVEANRTYWLRRLTEDYRTRFWVEEQDSGATVSETMP